MTKLLEHATENAMENLNDSKGFTLKQIGLIIICIVSFVLGWWAHKWYIYSDTPQTNTKVEVEVKQPAEKIQEIGQPIESVESLKKDAIKQGFAQYDAETGVWRWKTSNEVKPVRETGDLLPPELLPNLPPAEDAKSKTKKK